MIPIRTSKILLGVAVLLSFSLTGFTLVVYDAQDAPVGDAFVSYNVPDTSPSPTGIAATGEIIFEGNCKSCHRLDREMIGPGLLHVYSRRDSVWLRNWIRNSSKMIAGGDKTAVELFAAYKQTQMTNFSTMKKEDLDALLAYLEFVDNSN